MDPSRNQTGEAKLANARWAEPGYVAGRYAFEPGKLWLGRHPHDSEIALGQIDNKHVLVCAGTRSGKGRSFIINNLAVWPGSIASYDPKGDLATILAPRRGRGNQYCEGMGQDVFVLDPKRVADVEEDYRAFFNPLSVLDPDDDDFLVWCDRIADVIVKRQEGTESASWADKAKHFISMLIAHVRTDPFFAEEERNLLTVYRLCQEGHFETAEKLKAATGQKHDPFAMLLEEISANEVADGELARMARSFITDKEDQPKLFNSVRNEASSQLSFLKSQAIKKSIAPTPECYREIDFRDLKRERRGISVFVVLPTEDSQDLGRWANVVFLCLFAASRQDRAPPASGHQTLCVFDEFLDLGRNDYVRSALRNIAGAGVKLVIVVQGLGELDAAYKEEADAFYTNCGLKLFFGDTGREGPPFIEKTLGETQITLVSRSQTFTQSQNQTRTTSQSFSRTAGTSQSDTQGRNWSKSRSDTSGHQWSESQGWSRGVNWGDSRNWGEARGNSAGRSYGPHIFFEGFEKSTNYGTNLNRSSGGGTSRGGQSGSNGASVRGGQRSQTRGTTEGGQSSRTWSTQESETQQWSTSDAESHGTSQSEGTSEQFHKKPLLAAHEVRLYLRSFSEDDIDHPAYPGLMLVMIDGELPFFVRRSNYDQDPFFERCFSPDPAQTYIPLKDQPALGYAYTPDHVVAIVVPPQIKKWYPDFYEGVSTTLRAHGGFKRGGKLLSFFDHEARRVTVKAPMGGRVMEVKPDTDTLMVTRFHWPVRDTDIPRLEEALFGDMLKHVAKLDREQAEKDREERRRKDKEARDRREYEAEAIEYEKAQIRGTYVGTTYGAWAGFTLLGHLLFLGALIFDESIANDLNDAVAGPPELFGLSLLIVLAASFVAVGFTIQNVFKLSSEAEHDEFKSKAAQLRFLREGVVEGFQEMISGLKSISPWIVPASLAGFYTVWISLAMLILWLKQ